MGKATSVVWGGVKVGKGTSNLAGIRVGRFRLKLRGGRVTGVKNGSGLVAGTVKRHPTLVAVSSSMVCKPGVSRPNRSESIFEATVREPGRVVRAKLPRRSVKTPWWWIRWERVISAILDSNSWPSIL